jgi:hypothetical protein
MPKNIEHPWRNGGDDSKKPVVTVVSSELVRIIADSDTDADGSQRVGSIDPNSGQSHTSLRRSNGWKGLHEYVDSEVVPFFVLPLNWSEVTGIPAKLGDMAKLTFGQYTVYAIYADQGPRQLIGEASICAIEALGGNPWDNDKKRIVRGIPHGVTYDVRPSSANLARTVDFKSIQEYGQELFGEPSKPAQVVVWEELKRGAKGEAVKLLQKELNEHFDAELVVDGDFGPKTEAAVKKVEKILGFPENGTADVDVWKAIGTIVYPPPPINPDIIPNAIQCPTIPTRWTYEGGWCQGAILHFTAGKDNPTGTVEYLGKVGFPCIVMGRDGKVYQGFKASRGGCHSGTFHHDYSMGLEVIAAGRCTPVTIDGVKKYAPWFAYKDGNPETGAIKYQKECFSESEMRYVKDNGSMQEGWYHKYTAAQEESIVKTLLWYKWADPTDRFSFDKVLGHDEACDQAGQPGRKNDPGGALSMTMPEFRELLQKRWTELTAKPRPEQLAYFGYEPDSQ